MTQEDKELLLKDLCARLPYKPIIQFDGENYDLLALENCEPILARIIARDYKYSTAESKPLEDIKPYLRPMPIMTEEEKEDFEFIREWNGELNGIGGYYVEVDDTSKYIDYLNSHHFDYRGLIEKGLALEATKDMYKI